MLTLYNVTKTEENGNPFLKRQEKKFCILGSANYYSGREMTGTFKVQPFSILDLGKKRKKIHFSRVLLWGLYCNQITKISYCWHPVANNKKAKLI